MGPNVIRERKNVKKDLRGWKFSGVFFGLPFFSIFIIQIFYHPFLLAKTKKSAIETITGE